MDLIISRPSSQADVSPFQSEVHRSGQEGQVYSLDGYSRSRRLQIQISQLPLDGGGQGRPRNAKEDVHSPGQSSYWRAVDVKSRQFPQTQTDKQHLRQAWICKFY